jgi:hypothetical protein
MNFIWDNNKTFYYPEDKKHLFWKMSRKTDDFSYGEVQKFGGKYYASIYQRDTVVKILDRNEFFDKDSAIKWMEVAIKYGNFLK